MSRSDASTSQPGSLADQAADPSPGAGAGAGSEGVTLAAVIAERDALQAELAEAQQLADADMKALGEDSDRYIADLIAEHDAERGRTQEHIRQLEAQLERLQEKVDEHAIERYELVQERDAAQRALEDAAAAGPPGAPGVGQNPAEAAALSELAAELAEVRQLLAEVTVDRDELLLAVEATKADSVVEQERLVAELVESHHEEVASLSGELDSVSAAVLETEQQLEAARVEVAELEQRLSQTPQSSQPAAEESDLATDLAQQLGEAQAELQRAWGENALLQQLLDEARRDPTALLAESQALAAGSGPQAVEADLYAEAAVDLAPPADDLRATLPSADDGAVRRDTPELAVEAWDDGDPGADEPLPGAPLDALEAELGDGPGRAPAGLAAAAAEWQLDAPNGPDGGGGAAEWELEIPSGGAPGPGPPAPEPGWETETARISSEVTTEPPSSGDGPSLEIGDPSDPAPDLDGPAITEDPSEWTFDEDDEELPPPAPPLDLRDQTPTVPPRRAAREKQDTVPAGGDESDGTYSFVAPRRRRKKPPK